MIRGRRIAQGLPGLRGLSLSSFCDLVWVELWDDCPAMGDQVKYRDALHAIFYEGKEPARDPNAPAEKPDLSKPLPKGAVDQLKAMREKYGFNKPS